jgi:mannose/fructose/N-acetylgalactosamine-specific phosphotransferase system component IIC
MNGTRVRGDAVQTEEENLKQTLNGQRQVARASRIFVRSVVLVCAAFMLGVGLWALLEPRSFAAWISFPPYNEHLIHDAGAFQIGIGAALLLSLLLSRDALTVALGGFLVGGTLHVLNHAVDTHLAHLGGHASDPWWLAGQVLLAAAALGVHLRSRSHVYGKSR